MDIPRRSAVSPSASGLMMLDDPKDRPARAMASPGAFLSPSMLAAAPHRLLFFVGASNVLLAMLLVLVCAKSGRFDASQTTGRNTTNSAR